MTQTTLNPKIIHSEKDRVQEMPKFWANFFKNRPMNRASIGGFTERVSFFFGFAYYAILTMISILFFTPAIYFIAREIALSLNMPIAGNIALRAGITMLMASFIWPIYWSWKKFKEVRKGIIITIPPGHRGVPTIGGAPYYAPDNSQGQGIQESYSKDDPEQGHKFPDLSKGFFGLLEGAWSWGAIVVKVKETPLTQPLSNISSNERYRLTATAVIFYRVTDIYEASAYDDEERESLILKTVQTSAKNGLSRLTYEEIVTNDRLTPFKDDANANSIQGYDTATYAFYRALGGRGVRNVTFTDENDQVISHREFADMTPEEKDEVIELGSLRIEGIGTQLTQAYIEDADSADKKTSDAIESVARERENRKVAQIRRRTVINGAEILKKGNAEILMREHGITEEQAKRHADYLPPIDGISDEKAVEQSERYVGARKDSEFWMHVNGAPDSIGMMASSLLQAAKINKGGSRRK